MTGGENDQPRVEEVLASIRRIISDTQHTPIPELGVHSSATEREPDDFELPAMFRPERANNGPPAGLVARLTGAILGEGRLLPQDAVRETAEREPRRAFVPMASGGPEGASHSLSSDTHETGSAAPPSQSEVARVMAPMKDTLLARMGQQLLPPQLLSSQGMSLSDRLAAAVPPQMNAPAYCYGPVHSFRDMPTVEAGGYDIAKATIGARNYLIGEGALDPAYGADDAKFLPPQLVQDLPPAFKPRSEAIGTQPLAIEENTADLLRPLLKQWLEDNMERVFTRALQSESDTRAGGGRA
jgi:cell pole-organizing protein PopZ